MYIYILVSFSNSKNGLGRKRPCAVRRLALALIDMPVGKELEYGVGQVDGALEERQRDFHLLRLTSHTVLFVVGYGGQALRVGLDGRQDIGRKNGGEQSSAVDVRVGKREYDRQAETEAQVVGPSLLNVLDPLPDVPAHVAEFVLESVERVQKGEVNVAQELAQHARWYESHEGALHKENELHSAAKHGVCYDFGEREFLVDLRLFVLLHIRNVRYLLVTQHVEDFAQQKHRQDPDKGEEQLYARIQVVCD